MNGRNEDLITGVSKPITVAGVLTSVLIGKPVRKVGRSTGPTSGSVLDITQIIIEKGTPNERKMDEQIMVFVKECRDVRGDGTIFFATEGDSGAVLINRFNQVVGLVHKAPDPREIATDPQLAGFASACQIHHVTNKLKIDVFPSTDATTKGTPAVPTPMPPPPTPTGDSPDKRAALMAQAQSVAMEVSQRLDNKSGKLQIADGASDQEKHDYHLARIREILGTDFRILPRFTPENGGVLNQAFGDSLALQGNDRFAATTLIQRLTRVRDGVARLDATLRTMPVRLWPRNSR